MERHKEEGSRAASWYEHVVCFVDRSFVRIARLAQELPEEAQKAVAKSKAPKKDPLAGLPIEKRAAVMVTKELYQTWANPISTLEKVSSEIRECV